MKHTKIIVILSLCVALALSSCNKRHHTPDTSDEKIPLVFSAMSQSTAVKADTKEGFPHDDFGVCGIATQEGIETPYVLWNNALCQVKKSTVAGSEDYIPTSDAYWFKGYEYTFFGLAPYQAAVSDVSLQTSTPALAFTYDMGESYDDNGFMIATARKKYEGQADKSQDISFWHFFAKININIKFVDQDKNVLENNSNNAVTGIRICNVGSKGTYLLSHADSPVLGNGLIDENSFVDFSFQQSNPTFYIIPQDISNFEMYIDFTMETDNGVGSSDDYKLNLTFGENKITYYNYNQVYTWNITIGPKEAIGFNVTVNDWKNADGGDFEFPIQ
jgi:hypothetical protein